MSQRDQIRGNTIIPLTDHFGFGLPGADGSLDGSTGPRIIVTNGDPAGTVAPLGSMALDYSDGSVWTATNALGTGWVNQTSGETVLQDTAMFQEGGYTPMPTTATQSPWGSCGDLAEAAVGGAITYVDGGADGMFINYATNAAGNAEATAWSTDDTVNALALPYYLTRFSLVGALTDVRCFVGITDNISNMVSGDDPAATDYIGVQFSSVRADTNWQFMYEAQAGTATQVIVDSGYAVTADEVLFLEIEYITATTVVVRLRDSAFAIVASQTWTAVADVGLIIGGVGGGIETIVGAAARNFRLGEGHVYQKTTAGS